MTKKEYAEYQSIGFAIWLYKNNWQRDSDEGFFYRIEFYTKGQAKNLIHSKEKIESILVLYKLFCWMNDEINPFIQLSNGRYCQACGNSTTWSYDELFEMFKKENNRE